jgi:Ser/Thr protein kinase RdoA (MazF antagonist)
MIPPHSILQQYGFDEADCTIQPFGSGLLNHTWRVSTTEGVFILQRINDVAFKQPEDIAANIRLIAAHLRQQHPDYLFVAPTLSKSGEDMVVEKTFGYFRVFPFVPDSHSKDVVLTPNQAYEAAAQFGKFTQLLRGVNPHDLKAGIPDFHNLSLRYEQFLKALNNGNPERIADSKKLIDSILNLKNIVSVYEGIKINTQFKLRVCHCDTKISNVLFDSRDKGLCVIDLDTVMAGYFISDVGDMMRTYLSPVSEEAVDFDTIIVRPDFYTAICEGYLSEMNDDLTAIEKQYFAYAGAFMIYMQALRFLTDYLNNDVYYGAKYSLHNRNRAENQLVLLHHLQQL